jgi:murein L,D-transpeptidase YcbB/YkuD
LGDRIIKPDFEGHDVTELILILYKKGYIQIEGDTTSMGESKYEGDLIQAVKEFQKDYGLHQDGIVGNNTIKELLEEFHDNKN